jgi:hypothetical protein
MVRLTVVPVIPLALSDRHDLCPERPVRKTLAPSLAQARATARTTHRRIGPRPTKALPREYAS